MIQLLQGDCIEMMKTLPDKSVDAIITDPPFGTTACKWDSVIPFEPMWAELKRIIKPNGAIVLFGSQPFTSALIMSNIKMFKYEWVWAKDKAANFGVAKYRPMNIVENICVFSVGTPKYFPQKYDAGYKKNKGGKNSVTKGVYGQNGFKWSYDDTTMQYPKSIIFYATPKHNDLENKCMHPTQKPVALMEYLIKTYTNEGEIVLDFTAGSGTLGVAAINTNRNAILIERDAEYFKIIEKRISEAEQSKKNNLFAGE